MTQLEILKYAYTAVLMDWDKAYDRAQKRPDDLVAKYRLKAADEAYNEIRDLLLAEEQKAAI